MQNDKNKNLLSEELKKFKLMSEYAFYEDRAEDKFEKGEELILGMTEEDNTDELDDEANAVADELSSDELGAGLGPEGGEEELDALEAGDEELGDEEMGNVEDEPMEEPIEEPADDSVELDITELVKGTDEATMAAQAATAASDSANEKMGKLMSMVANLEQQLDSMSAISHKIDNLEQELEKRAPTPEEKIEMRSLDSYPYSLKLTDFWSQQKGQYDIMNDKEEEKEYVLTKKDVDSTYSDSMTKDSFDDNPYEEEEI